MWVPVLLMQCCVLSHFQQDRSAALGRLQSIITHCPSFLALPALDPIHATVKHLIEQLSDDPLPEASNSGNVGGSMDAAQYFESTLIRMRECSLSEPELVELEQRLRHLRGERLSSDVYQN